VELYAYSGNLYCYRCEIKAYSVALRYTIVS
jgi:hypothetical protein